MDIADIMNMTDEELSNTSDFGDNTVANANTEDSNQTETNQIDDEEGTDAAEDDATETTTDDDDNDDDSSSGSKEEDKNSEDDKSASSNEEKKEGESTSEVETEPDYKELYSQIMKPFKANGHEIKLDSPEEVVKLMQMGANYVKKMQAIQPNLKVLRMLENHSLLDENKLSHLIDISKGDKAALAKFMKDNSIEPMDIDTESEVEYRQGNHTVSDTEIEFQTILDEVISTDSGQELITHVQNQWDQASKQAIFQKPELIRVIAQHAKDGVYDQIATEVHRQKVLGDPQIASLPFLSAYQRIGQQMAENNQLKLPESKPVVIAKTAPINTKKNQITNAAQAKAASPSAKSTGKAKVVINPLDGSDEEFLKAFEGKI